MTSVAELKGTDLSNQIPRRPGPLFGIWQRARRARRRRRRPTRPPLFMPPGPLYNWLAVSHSILEILEHAAQYRAAQLSRQGAAVTRPRTRRTEGTDEEALYTKETEGRSPGRSAGVNVAQPNALHRANEEWLAQLSIPPRNTSQLVDSAPKDSYSHRPHTDTAFSSDMPPSRSADVETASTQSTSGRVEVPYIAASTEQLFSPQNYTRTADNISPSPSLTDAQETLSTSANYPIRGSAIPPADLLIADPVGSVKAQVPDDLFPSSIAPNPEEIPTETLLSEPQPSRHLQSSKVPSSRLGRLFHYGGLAASLGVGAASEYLRRSTGASNGAQSSSLMMSEANVTRLVSKLSKMRGAALKLGQFMSIQDTHVLPPEVEKVFRRVQDSAHYMPNWQMEQVLTSSLGPSWRDNFASFDAVPFAAASIGQVHHAVLKASASPTGADARVAVKIQFPNIRQSVESDLGYMKVLLTAGRLLPPGLFLDKTMAVMKEELADECDYTREAGFLRAFGAAERLGKDARYKVPWVWDGSTGEVLVMERVDGVSVGGDVVHHLSQADRDDIAARIIELCLRELFVFRQMQTDPNWTNFLWNARTRQIELVDFGATRAYSATFIDNWLRLLRAAATSDREACREWSLKLGYLTGEENDVMLDAHVRSMALLATPFRADTLQPFAFGKGSRWAEITAEIRAQIPTMLQYRLTPPPRETYSLNRKLSGAFLLAARLDARVDCKALWDKVTRNYQFSS